MMSQRSNSISYAKCNLLNSSTLMRSMLEMSPTYLHARFKPCATAESSDN